MSRAATILYLIGGVYIALVVAFHAAIVPGNTGVAWHVWRLCATLTLLPGALELVLVVLWFGVRLSLLRTEDCVPERLSPDQRWALDASGVQVAMLLPAHREAASPDDARALADRVTDLILKTPRFAELYLLFDSPPDEQDNELGVIEKVRAELRNRGRAADADRLRFEEYRAKPARYRNKPGSIALWLDCHSQTYEYMFVLDADSSLPDEDPTRPGMCEVLSRMVYAMEQSKGEPGEIAMVQAAILIRPAREGERRSVWARVQAAGAWMGLRYNALVLQWVLRGQVASYGHHVLFRIEPFLRHACNTHEYLSHDLIDASDLAAAGCRCENTLRAIGYDEPESSLLQWVARDFRWARGNAAWAVYWVTKPLLPLGPRFSLACGILAYALPIAGTLFLISSAILIGQAVPLISHVNSPVPEALLGVVLFALFFPKLVACRGAGELAVAILPPLLMTPALSVLSGLFFLLGAFGTGWTLRGHRSAEFDLAHGVDVMRIFLPVALLGAVLWSLIDGPGGPWANLLVAATVLSLLGSPLMAVLFSVPWPIFRRATWDFG